MAGVDLDSRWQLGESRQRGVEVFGALARGDREIGPGCIADEQRVARQHDALVDHEGAVLGPVPRRVQHADRHRADREDIAVRQRLRLELGLGERMHRDRQAVLQREPAVPGHMVGVRVGLEHALDADAFLLGGGEQLVNGERWVDDDRHARRTVTDEIRRAAEVFVHELPEEQHGPRR